MTFESKAATSGDGGDPTSGKAAEEDLGGEDVATSELPDFEDMVHVVSSEVLMEDAIASNLSNLEAGGQGSSGPPGTNEAWELRGTQWVRKSTTGSPTSTLVATLAAQQFFIGDAHVVAHEARADNAFTLLCLLLAVLVLILIYLVCARCFPKRAALVGGDGGDPTPKTQDVPKYARMPHIKASVGNTIVETGKHKGKTFREIVERFPEYLTWCEQHRSMIGFQKAAMLEYAIWVSETKER